MDLGAIFLLLTVVSLTAMFVSQPFLQRRRSVMVQAGDHDFSHLLAERDRLITALQELDFDFTLEKIPAQDYPAMRAGLLQQAADVLRKLDALQPAEMAQPDAESRLEAVIAARRADAAVQKEGPAQVSDADLEDIIASRRAARKEKSSGFCPKCGKTVLRSDRFCPSCGKPIS